MHYDQSPPSHYEYTIQAAPITTANNVKMVALLAMKKLEGWCSNYKATTLMDLVWLIRPNVVVEIGVFGGKSLVPMAFALKATGQGMIYAIDPWNTDASIACLEEEDEKYWAKIDHNAIYQDLQNKITDFKLEKHISLITSTAESADPINNIDILHIDGNHSEQHSFADVIKWVPLVRSGGFIIFDDIDWKTMVKAPKWLNENCTKLVEVVDENNCWGIWVKP